MATALAVRSDTRDQFPMMALATAWGWLGEAKVSCILCHLGIQLISAYNWARPVILAAGKGRGGDVFLFLLFLHCHSFSFLPWPSH